MLLIPFPRRCLSFVSMQRLRSKESWSLFDPLEVPLLLTTTGAAFTTAYEEYERTVVPLERVPSRDLWNVVCRAQQESGTPFLMYQDNINGERCCPTRS